MSRPEPPDRTPPAAGPSDAEQTLEIGVIVKPHGVQGAVKLHLHNPASEALEQSERLGLDQGGTTRWCAFSVRGVGRGSPLILELEGVETMEAAEALRGARVLVERAALGPLAEDEFYYQDLIGCRVEDEELGELGQVSDVFEAGASELLVVRDGQRELLIPLVGPWVERLEPAEGRIRVRGGRQWRELAEVPGGPRRGRRS